VVWNTCASGCALIWLAGTPRAAFIGAHIGFHSSWRSTAVACGQYRTCKRADVSSSGNAAIGTYLAELGFSYTAIQFFTQAEPDSMEWLSREKAQALGLAVMSFDKNGNPTP
jgi:hypothetical protein